jgi:PE-PPE domain
MQVQTAVGRKRATRIGHSLLVAGLAVAGTLLIAFGSTVATAVKLLAYTPIVMTGTFTADPDPQYVAMAMNDFILPSRDADNPPPTPDYNTPVPLDTPEQAWPITGLFDLVFGRSVQIGWDDLQDQIAETTVAGDGQPIIVFGYSQSAVISTHEKRRLDELYPVGGPAPDIQFVMIGDLNRPNGGVMTRFQGADIPFIDFYFDGPAPSDTNFETVDIARQYDGFADFPLYPINLVADLNALLGILYVHTDYEAVSLNPDDPDYVAGTIKQQYGDTTYYTIPTSALPLLQPLRDLGVPEPLMALVEPALRVVVEAGYDRTLNPGVPAKAQLIPRLDPVQFAGDVVAALGQGVEDAVDEIENPTPRPPGPTPTERVLTEIVQTNVSHTVESINGILGGGVDDDEAADTDTAETETVAETDQSTNEVSKATTGRPTRPTRTPVDESADSDPDASDSEQNRRKETESGSAVAEKDADASTDSGDAPAAD